MATTQIPPRDPRPAQPSAQRGGSGLPHTRDIYFRAAHTIDAPALLVQLQDDLTRSRRREAFWISVVFHLALIILLVNAERIARYLPVWQPADTARLLQQQRELTYLELPPDIQKLNRRPPTDVISDKDRRAMHTAPLDPKELRKILGSTRPGAPAEQEQPAPPQPPAQQQPAQQAESAKGGLTAPAPDQNQQALLHPPAGPKPSFSTPLSAGSAIQQAAREALSHPGGGGGDYGMYQGRQGGTQGDLDILSDTMGVDFDPYMRRLRVAVMRAWEPLIPESARHDGKKGRVTIQFAILKDGTVYGAQIVQSSGDVALDRAAWGAIHNANPPPLPADFKAPYLEMRGRFYYNPDKNDLE
jgi:TonB family protein